MIEDLTDNEREEALMKWWRDNWPSLLAGIALGVALLIGWQYWQKYQAERADQAARLYTEARAAFERSDTEQGAKLVASLSEAHGSSPYAQQARLLLAKSHVEQGKYAEALPLLQKVREEARDTQLVNIATLRFARLQLQLEKYDAALAVLQPEKMGGFAAEAHAVRGDALQAKGDAQGARAEYAAALADKQGLVDAALVELKMQDVALPPTADAKLASDTAAPAAQAPSTPPPATPSSGESKPK
jgi:predicted negative regulator of RcsB-dependent stress response